MTETEGFELLKKPRYAPILKVAFGEDGLGRTGTKPSGGMVFVDEVDERW